MNNLFTCTKNWCLKNKTNLIPAPALLGVLAVIYTYHSVGTPWQLPLILWIAAIIIPLILGMAEKVRFRWVLLWEAVMLFPIGLIVMIFFGSAIIGILRKT